MAIEGSRELKTELADIAKGKAKPVYLVFGTEPYLVRNSAEAIVDALAAGGAEVVRQDAEGKSVQAILEPLTTLSLFSSARITVVRNFAHVLTGDSATHLLTGIEKGLAPGSALVLVGLVERGGPQAKVDKRSRGYKGLAKLGAVLEFGTQKPEDLAAWLRAKAADEKKKLTGDAAMLLLTRAGHDMETLRMELDKALLYCLEQDTIGADDLAKLVGKSREEAVWDVATAVVAGQPVRAMELIEDLLAAGTYPLVLLTLLVRQTRHLLQARLLWERAGSPAFRDFRSFQARVSSTWEPGAFGKGPDDVTTIHPFAGFKRFEAARAHPVSVLRRMLSRVRRADLEAKTGALAGPREVLEELVFELCGEEAAA